MPSMVYWISLSLKSKETDSETKYVNIVGEQTFICLQFKQIFLTVRDTVFSGLLKRLPSSYNMSMSKCNFIRNIAIQRLVWIEIEPHHKRLNDY